MKTKSKVLLSLALLLVLSFALVVPASAASTSDTFRFDYRINCRYTTDPLIATLNSGYKELAAGKLFVRHYLTTAPVNYVNLFRGLKNDAAVVGQKWATPGLNVPIESSSITTQSTYKLLARGNTDYYTNYGYTTILVNGNCYYNLGNCPGALKG